MNINVNISNNIKANISIHVDMIITQNMNSDFNCNTGSGFVFLVWFLGGLIFMLLYM